MDNISISILFEIVTYIHPTDLLNLICTSKWLMVKLTTDEFWSLRYHRKYRMSSKTENRCKSYKMKYIEEKENLFRDHLTKETPSRIYSGQGSTKSVNLSFLFGEEIPIQIKPKNKPIKKKNK